MMSALTTLRKNLTRPLGAVILLAIAAVVWAVTLRSQLSPAQQHLEAGIDAARRSQLGQAESEWREALRLSPEDTRAWNDLAELYIDTHRWPDALDALHQIEHLSPETPHLRARLALCNLKTGDEQAAYHYAEASLHKDPNDPDTILLFCGLLAKTHENQRRLDLLRQLARMQPDNLSVQTLLATTLTDKRQWDEARPLVEQILRRDPGNLEAYSLHGMILLNTDTTPSGLKQAESDFLRTVTTPRFTAFANYNLGKIYERLGRPQQAIAPLEAAAQAMPTHREIWFDLAEAYTRSGQTQKAERARLRSEALKSADQKGP